MTPTIEQLVPSGSRADLDALRALDADRLAGYAVDGAHEWWRRRACLRALEGRVPEPWIGELIARIHDRGEVTEVRTALLELLADRTELLPWLRQADLPHEAYGMAEAILKARGLLGDRTAAPELATLAASPWQHRRILGEAGLEALVARFGVGAVLADLGEARAEDRIFALRTRHRAGADVTAALADPDPEVAHLAHTLLTDPDRLRGCLAQPPTAEAALWALCALHRLTGDAAETRAGYERLGRPRVEVAGLDEELRSAVVHEYARDPEGRTDPRWRVEYLCTEPPARPDQEDQLRRVVAALAATGFAHRPPVPCGVANRQGGGTYHVIEYGDGGPDGDDADELWISTLGRFATAFEKDHPVLRPVLEAAGFRWIDRETADLLVTGLCVYRFGRREPLTVEQLLFYWQD